jgi:hypothetical protein
MKSKRVLPADVKSDLDRLTAEFFRVVSFQRGENPRITRCTTSLSTMGYSSRTTLVRRRYPMSASSSSLGRAW